VRGGHLAGARAPLADPRGRAAAGARRPGAARRGGRVVRGAHLADARAPVADLGPLRTALLRVVAEPAPRVDREVGDPAGGELLGGGEKRGAAGEPPV